MMRSLLSLLLLPIIVSSCTIFKNISGEYICKPARFVNATLTLNSDSSFQYSYIAGDLYKIDMKGKWKLSDDNSYILLNSNLQSDNDLVKVEEKEISKLNKIKICVVDEDNNPFPAYVTLHPASQITPNKLYSTEGCSYYPKQVVKTLEITYLGSLNRTIFYKVNHQLANMFIIHIKTKAGHQRYFNNTKWKIKGKKLYDTDTLYDKACHIYHKQ